MARAMRSEGLSKSCGTTAGGLSSLTLDVDEGEVIGDLAAAAAGIVAFDRRDLAGA
jgi:hypothetical protein